jgi:DisA bacterial checkpoint controller nucleotide-binding
LQPRSDGIPGADRTTRSQRRLADELDDDQIIVGGDRRTRAIVVGELDYTRRTPMFEGRRPNYGAIITTSPDSLAAWQDVGVDLLDVPGDLDPARTYADGRSSYLVRNPAEPSRLAIACFDRPLLFEADVVLLQEATGAQIVQRTPVFGVTRLFQDREVVSWDGRSWTARTTAYSLLPNLRAELPDLDPDLARGLLTLAVHWLAPARAGATIVVHHGGAEGSFDTSGATTPPGLRLTNRRHYPPLLSFLLQHDLATLVDTDGTVRAIGVGLLSSTEADAAITNDRGMRHRSAQRWSFDHPHAVVVVVSSDGPVTVYRAGDVMIGHA